MLTRRVVESLGCCLDASDVLVVQSLVGMRKRLRTNSTDHMLMYTSTLRAMTAVGDDVAIEVLRLLVTEELASAQSKTEHVKLIINLLSGASSTQTGTSNKTSSSSTCISTNTNSDAGEHRAGRLLGAAVAAVLKHHIRTELTASTDTGSGSGVGSGSGSGTGGSSKPHQPTGVLVIALLVRILRGYGVRRFREEGFLRVLFTSAEPCAAQQAQEAVDAGNGQRDDNGGLIESTSLDEHPAESLSQEDIVYWQVLADVCLALQAVAMNEYCVLQRQSASSLSSSAAAAAAVAAEGGVAEVKPRHMRQSTKPKPTFKGFGATSKKVPNHNPNPNPYPDPNPNPTRKCRRSR